MYIDLCAVYIKVLFLFGFIVYCTEFSKFSIWVRRVKEYDK